MSAAHHTLLRHLDWRRAMTGMGHEDQFPPQAERPLRASKAVPAADD